MQKLRRHIRFLRQVPLVLFALFALASCSVKEPVFKAIGADYHRPLNPTKAMPSLGHSCQLSEQVNLASVTTSQLNPLKLLAAVKAALHLTAERKAEAPAFPAISRTEAPEKQPLYILYKRLKSDLQ
ncbi:hypothetical protein [Maribellus sp. YY47]|uniref:hypothetical protein n=1 Tax=Maribellus sp. YY47 TaxID=2929486 RepID=UPI002000D390|nr:hypothetical protein [Maribellus sp. YY47]MCK3685811.1 hypothetical protein [Maribellus sp. YY47]